MKHYTTVDASSVVIKRDLSGAFGRAAIRELSDTMDVSPLTIWESNAQEARISDMFEEQRIEVMATLPGANLLPRTTLLDVTCNFVLEKYSYPWSEILERMLTPAQFRVFIELRAWNKKIRKQVEYLSPSRWSRTTDFVYVNLNRGKSIVFVDAHYWD